MSLTFDPPQEKPMSDDERKAQYKADLEAQVAALQFAGKNDRAAQVQKVLDGLESAAPETAAVETPEMAVKPKARARKPATRARKA